MNNSDFQHLVDCLADGQYHSGEALGVRLGVSRAAIWKRLQLLAGYGIEVESVKGLGYRVRGGFSLLDSNKIESLMSVSAREYLNRLNCFNEINSTNEYLLRGSCFTGDVCLSERQTAGRGRRGREWFSPFAKNLYLSVCWHFDQGVAALDGLSLAVGVLLVESLSRMGVEGVQLKWPNDLLVEGRGGVKEKLGGILIEVGGDLTGECKVVVGIGLNVSMSDVASRSDRSVITQPWCDLSGAGYCGDRNALAASVLSGLLPALSDYSEQGFTAYRERWEALNICADQKVNLILPGRMSSGVMSGVDDKGALILETESGEEVFSGGEVSLRMGKHDY